MKKWMYVATAVVLCGTISCSSKKESKSTQSYTTSTEVLQGSWNIISVDGKKSSAKNRHSSHSISKKKEYMGIMDAISSTGN